MEKMQERSRKAERMKLKVMWNGVDEREEKGSKLGCGMRWRKNSGSGGDG